jgi:colanic acid/amylovoran biosynthesis protein
MSAPRIIRKVRKRAEEIAAASAMSAAADRSAIALDAARATGVGPHVLLASAGAGNIGDQAMVEAFIEQVDGPVTVITRHEGDFAMPTGEDDRVTFTALEHLVYGSGPARRADLARFGALVQDAASFSVIGADIMDGKYSPRGSVRRATLAEAAAAAGVPTRILGFSWNAAPHRRAAAALRRAARAGVVPLLRDPVSAERARADGIEGVVDTADLVFTARTADDAAPRRILGPLVDGSSALVNVSALVGRSLDQRGEYAAIVRHLRALGHGVVLLPHVSRPSSDDIAACAAVAELLADDPGVVLVDRLLTPVEIRGLTRRASVVVTGRMHLAIMSIWARVPAVTLATQGKVEGLMRLIGAPELCVTPGPDLAERVIDVLDRLDPATSGIRAAVTDAGPVLRSLSERNTEALVASARPTDAHPSDLIRADTTHP